MKFDRYFWILGILFTVGNGLYYRYRARKVIAVNPELKEGYDKAFWWWVTLGNLPWVVMGIGILSGVDGMRPYFYPAQGSPFVLAFHASILLTSIGVSIWVLFRGGAEFLVRHQGLINIKSVVGIKLFSVGAILFWVIWLVVAWRRV